MDFYGLVEEWPDESFVVFRELPRCFSRQNDITILEEEVDSINVVIRERLQRTNSGPPRFEADLPGPTDREIDNALNVTAAARAQIIEMYEVLRGIYPVEGIPMGI